MNKNQNSEPITLATMDEATDQFQVVTVTVTVYFLSFTRSEREQKLTFWTVTMFEAQTKSGFRSCYSMSSSKYLWKPLSPSQQTSNECAKYSEFFKFKKPSAWTKIKF